MLYLVIWYVAIKFWKKLSASKFRIETEMWLSIKRQKKSTLHNVITQTQSFEKTSNDNLKTYIKVRLLGRF